MAALSAITGLGLSPLSRNDIGTSRDLAIEAVVNAVDDAGLSLRDIDGLLLAKSPSASLDSLPLHLRDDLALPPLKLLCQVEGEGTSVAQTIQYATFAIRHGMATRIVCVFADARIGGQASGKGYAKPMDVSGLGSWDADHGLLGAIGPYALQARRYMDRFGLTEQALGAYAIACRRWAVLNPLSFARTELTMDAYLASRQVVSPLRLLDCAFPINGAAAVVVEAAGRCTDRVCVYVHGIGQGHAGDTGMPTADLALGARMAADACLGMAGIDRKDVAQVQMYDPFSSVGLQLLEAYGFCDSGEAGELVRSGATSPGGRLPVNTGGGHLSGFYLQGMTPVVEAVMQLRGQAGARQCTRGPTLVGALGGCMQYHAALLLSHEETLA